MSVGGFTGCTPDEAVTEPQCAGHALQSRWPWTCRSLPDSAQARMRRPTAAAYGVVARLALLATFGRDRGDRAVELAELAAERSARSRFHSRPAGRTRATRLDPYRDDARGLRGAAIGCGPSSARRRPGATGRCWRSALAIAPACRRSHWYAAGEQAVRPLTDFDAARCARTRPSISST